MAIKKFENPKDPEIKIHNLIKKKLKLISKTAKEVNLMGHIKTLKL